MSTHKGMISIKWQLLFLYDSRIFTQILGVFYI